MGVAATRGAAPTRRLPAHPPGHPPEWQRCLARQRPQRGPRQARARSGGAHLHLGQRSGTSSSLSCSSPCRALSASAALTDLESGHMPVLWLSFPGRGAAAGPPPSATRSHSRPPPPPCSPAGTPQGLWAHLRPHLTTPQTPSRERKGKAGKRHPAETRPRQTGSGTRDAAEGERPVDTTTWTCAVEGDLLESSWQENQEPSAFMPPGHNC